MIAAVFFDVGETIVDESHEYGTWADWLGVPQHTFSAVFRCRDRSRSGLPGDVPSVPAGVRPRGKRERALPPGSPNRSARRTCTQTHGRVLLLFVSRVTGQPGG